MEGASSDSWRGRVCSSIYTCLNSDDGAAELSPKVHTLAQELQEMEDVVSVETRA